MEASAISNAGPGLKKPVALLRLQSDEKLVAMTRRGDQSAYEALMGRYHARILGFTRHMLGSREDAEDVTQESFAAAYSAMMADERPINVKPWLYRIARNRSLNHMRRQKAIGVDDVYATCDRIRELGGKIVREAGPMKGGRTVIAFVEDPDGYKVEILQDEPNPG